MLPTPTPTPHLYRLTPPLPSRSCGPLQSSLGCTYPPSCPCECGAAAHACRAPAAAAAAVPLRGPALPAVLPLPLTSSTACACRCIIFCITSIETVGDVAATEEASYINTSGPTHDRRIRGALLNDGGWVCFLATCFTSKPPPPGLAPLQCAAMC